MQPADGDATAAALGWLADADVERIHSLFERARLPVRGPALAASGMVALWVAFSALFLGAVDHRRSFAGLASSAAAEIARAAPADACVLAHHLRPSHRAVFAFHGGIRFASGDDDDCPLALHRDLAGSLLDDGLPAGRWTELWQGHRPGRPDEAIRLYRRAGD